MVLAVTQAGTPLGAELGGISGTQRVLAAILHSFSWLSLTLAHSDLIVYVSRN